MSKKWKGLISLFVCLALMMSAATVVFARSNDNGLKGYNYLNSAFNSKGFKDVKENHWAYDAIMWMFEKGIINGVGNNNYNPNGTVTRAEFAKMMVNTLNLKKYYPDNPSFLDVDKKNWAYPYVEGAKNYLTGWKTTSGHYYKPSQAAVREDMAVALVNALGYQNETIDESNLSQFADAGSINVKLKRHVALAVKHGLMEGSNNNGQKVFNAQGSLTRAEAAVLLHRAFIGNEEKITYDEDKVTYDDDGYEKPLVSVAKENGTLVVRWNNIASSKLKGYKVVISKNDSTPSYPDNGYLYYITDANKTYAVIDN
ncbi:MAG: S-layer homology domain-containing protein, partial [Clostridiaceae bacterium]|nr:S-layer homology domain-containing protein [Clostridiaceae bacterium]